MLQMFVCVNILLMDTVEYLMVVKLSLIHIFPKALRKVNIIAPPTRTLSAFTNRFSITPILSETFAPPRIVEKLTLAKHACHIRMGVIEGTHSAKCGHPGGSLDIAEVLSYLYFVDMNVDPKAPKKPDRDRLVLSKGHAAPALYAALAERGFFPVEDLKTLRKIGKDMHSRTALSWRAILHSLQLLAVV